MGSTPGLKLLCEWFGLMFCCYQLEIGHEFWTRGRTFYFRWNLQIKHLVFIHEISLISVFIYECRNFKSFVQIHTAIRWSWNSHAGHVAPLTTSSATVNEIATWNSNWACEWVIIKYSCQKKKIQVYLNDQMFHLTCVPITMHQWISVHGPSTNKIHFIRAIEKGTLWIISYRKDDLLQFSFVIVSLLNNFLI